MLTVAKLAVLIKYRWDNHLFTKQASAQEKELLAAIDWDDISEILQDLTRYHHQLVSAGYAKKYSLTSGRFAPTTKPFRLYLATPALYRWNPKTST